MPEALSVVSFVSTGASSCARSRPLEGAAVFLVADLLFLGALRAGVLFSSSARRASRSAFLRASSAFLAASASLSSGQYRVARDVRRKVQSCRTAADG